MLQDTPRRPRSPNDSREREREISSTSEDSKERERLVHTLLLVISHHMSKYK